VSAWTKDELDRIAAADELELASVRRDGSLRKPVTIWVVRVGDDLFVRSIYGRGSGWFRGVLSRHEGHVRAGGVDRDVRFVEVAADAPVHDEIDAVFQSKYGHYPARYVGPTVTPQARAATLELAPR